MCYDLAGDLVSVTSPRAGATAAACPGTSGKFTATYVYDNAHRQLIQRDPLGNAKRTTYDPNGNVASVEQDIDTNRAGRQEIEYDQRDQPVLTRERFDGATGRNVISRMEYDRAGNLKRKISPRASDAGGAGPYTDYVTSYEYDQLNRPVRINLPFDGADGAERQYVHRAYDANGNLDWTSLPVTSPNAADVKDSARNRMTYFDPGWIATSKDPRNPKVRYDYAAQGFQIERMPELKNAPGQPNTGRRTIWEYFDDGQLKSRKDEQGQPSTYSYDGNNNLTVAIDASGLSDNSSERRIDTRAAYTGFDEVAKVRHRKQGEATWKFASYAYDPNGNVTLRLENGEENDAGTQTKAPNRHQITYTDNDWLATQLDLGTDGNCAGDQHIVNTFWRDGLEKQREIFRAAAGCTADPAGWPKQQTTNWTFSDNGKQRTLTTKDGSGQVTESHDVGYFDDNGQYVNGNRTTDRFILKRAEGNQATTCVGPSTCLAKWSYNARDKLVRHQKREGKVTTYKFDEPDKLGSDPTIRAGNVTTENNDKGETITRRYQADQATEISVGGATGKYFYDEFGNTKCLVTSGGGEGDCGRSNGQPGSPNLISDYSYDYLNRLANIRQYSGGGTPTDTTDYTYDALDRTGKEVEDHAGTGKDRTTEFTYQGMTNLATEEKQSGGDSPKTKSFSYDKYGKRMSMTDKDNASGQEDKYTYSHDAHGSVSQLIGQSGQVRASYGYDAYGGSDAGNNEPEALSTGDTDSQAPVNPYRYSGKRQDSGAASSSTPPVPAGSASYDMGARRYGPETGRFLQEDMFQGALADLGLSLDPLTQNRYSLAGGNPVSFVEMDGHLPSLSDIGNAIKEGVNKVGNFLGGVKDAAEDTLNGIQQLANDADQVLGTSFQPNEQEKQAAKERFKQRGHLLTHPKELWNAIKQPYEEDVNSGQPERAAGRAVFDIGTLFAGGVGGASKAAKAGGATGKTAQAAGQTAPKAGAPKALPPASSAATKSTGGAAGGGGAAAGGAAAGGASRGPSFIAHPGGDVVPVPRGATGPTPTQSGAGVQFTGGSGGGLGLNSRVTGIRVMDPTFGGPYPHPHGYVVYMNRMGQTVHPYTGHTIPNSHPMAHLDWTP
jgi:RHS repeat-associated protein